MKVLRKLARIGIIMSASSLAVLLVMETVVRALDLAPPPRGANKILRVVTARASEARAPGVCRVLKPGTQESHVYVHGDGRERRVDYRINSLGIRDRETGRTKAAGTYRVCALGDSFTFGTAISLEETWPKALERVFARERETEERPIEVLNCGLEALNLPQQAALLENRVAHMDPDLVVVCAYINDASGHGIEPPVLPEDLRRRMSWVGRLGLTSGVWAAGEELNDEQRRMMSLRRRSKLVDFCAHRAYRALYGAVKVAGYRLDWAEGSPGREAARGALERMHEIARCGRFRLHVVMYPVLTRLSDDYPYRAQHATVAELCASLDLPFTDLLPALEGRDAAALHAHEHDAHPNGTANEQVAAYLAPVLLPSILADPSD